MQKFFPKINKKQKSAVNGQTEFFPRSFKKWNPGPFARISEIAKSIQGSKQLQATLKN